MRRARGFTLIEVLVALAIAALGLGAVLSIVTNSARSAAGLRDRTIASWVAGNRLTETRLEGSLPSVDRTTGEADMAGQRWQWEQVVTNTQVPGIRRVDVRVRFAATPGGPPLATLSGFVGRTQAQAPQSTVSWEGAASAGGPGVPGTAPPEDEPPDGRAPRDDRSPLGRPRAGGGG